MGDGSASEASDRALFGRILTKVYARNAGVTPPELVALVEGPGAPAPGRALELGCGTGTNAVYPARHGWRVAVVDLDVPVLVLVHAAPHRGRSGVRTVVR